MHPYNLLQRIIPSIQQVPDLLPSERQMITQETWQSILALTQESVFLIEALIHASTIEMMLDHHLINGIPQDKISNIVSRLETIRLKKRKWNALYNFRAPTDECMHVEAKSIYEYELKPAAEMIDEMIKLTGQAHTKTFGQTTSSARRK